MTTQANDCIKDLIAWDDSQYVNIWVVESIDSSIGAAAYTYLPGTLWDEVEGIIINHEYLGSIGSSNNTPYKRHTLSHEFGHYFIGKLSGIHAEVFSIGFGPVLLSRYDKNGTKWQIAAFPLGGVVKFLGEGKLSSSKHSELNSKIDSDFKRRTMQGSPLWARFITVAAGPIFNFIFSGIIFFCIFLGQGTTQLPVTVANLFELPYNFALRKGDVVLSINGVNISEELENISPSQKSALSNSPAFYVIERAGNVLELKDIVQNPPRISQVLPKSAAISAGLEAGDVILSINSEQIDNFDQIKAFVEASDGKAINLEYWRNGSVQYTSLTPLIVDVPDPEGGFERIFRIGIVGGLFPFEPVRKRQPF